MKKLFFPFLLLLSLTLHSAIDSTQVAKLIEKGSLEFCHILDINEEAISSHHPEEMQFVIDVPVDYVHTHLEGNDTSSIFTDHVIKDSLNARIRRIYQQCGIELYIVVINSLDVIVHTSLPPNTTSSDFFIKKLYNEQTNLDSIKKVHDHITESILAQSLSGHNRDCIVFSDAQYRGCFFANGKQGCWEYAVVSDHHGATDTYPKLSELQNLFSVRLENNHDAHSGALSYMLPVVVDEFEKSANYFRLEMMIKQAWTPTELDAIFTGFNNTLNYESLTSSDRQHAISVYTGYPMNENWFGGGPNQEAHVLNVIKYTPANQVHQLLYVLSRPNELKNNPDYHGDASDDALIKKLVDHIDDVGIPFFSADNYTTLISAITQLELSSEQTCSENLPGSAESKLNMNIYWDDSYLFSCPPVGTTNYDITLNADGTVTAHKQVVSSWNTDYNNAAATAHHTPNWDNTYAPYTYQPFDLIAFSNRSNVGMLQSVGAQKNSVFVAPAIILKYADDKNFNANAVRAAAVSADVIALATGTGEIMAAFDAGNMARAAFEALQCLGATGNLAVQGITDPALQSLVEKYNLIMGAWGLASIVNGGAQLTAIYFEKAAAGELKTISVSQAQEYENAFQSAGTKVNDLPENVKTQVTKMEEYLEGKSGVVATASLLETRTNWLNNLKAQYGELDFDGFTTMGINKSNVPTALYNEMLNGYSSNLPQQMKESFLDNLINSGSDIPVKRTMYTGDELYKVVPKDKAVGQSAYYMTKTEYESLENSSLLEQKLGLPLGSHSVQYDVYKATANETVDVFESTVASTMQRGYSTSGGAKQTFILNTNKWTIAKVNTITPNK